jgi:hypothetical protein
MHAKEQAHTDVGGEAGAPDDVGDVCVDGCGGGRVDDREEHREEPVVDEGLHVALRDDGGEHVAGEHAGRAVAGEAAGEAREGSVGDEGGGVLRPSARDVEQAGERGVRDVGVGVHGEVEEHRKRAGAERCVEAERAAEGLAAQGGDEALEGPADADEHVLVAAVLGEEHEDVERRAHERERGARDALAELAEGEGEDLQHFGAELVAATRTRARGVGGVRPRGVHEEVHRGEGEQGREGALAQDLVGEVAGDVGEGPGSEVRVAVGRGIREETHERAHGAAAGDDVCLLGRAGRDVDEHPEGVVEHGAVEERRLVEEAHEYWDQTSVDDGLHGGVGAPGDEAAAGHGRVEPLLGRPLQRAEHDAVVQVHQGGALVEAVEVGEPACIGARGGPDGAGERGEHGGGSFLGRIFLGGILKGLFFLLFVEDKTALYIPCINEGLY